MQKSSLGRTKILPRLFCEFFIVMEYKTNLRSIDFSCYRNIANITGIVTIEIKCEISAIEAPGVVSPP